MYVRVNVSSYTDVLLELSKQAERVMMDLPSSTVYGERSRFECQKESVLALWKALCDLHNGALSSLIVRQLRGVCFDDVVTESIKEPMLEIYQDVLRYLRKRYDINPS